MTKCKHCCLKILQTICVIAATLPGASNATHKNIINNEDLRFKPYFGIELQRQALRFSKSTGDIFPKHSDQANLFVGITVHKNLKLEVGYTHGKKAERSVTIHADDIFLGNVSEDRDFGNYLQTSRYKAAHIDLLPQIALTKSEKLKLYGIASLCWQSLSLSTSQIAYRDYFNPGQLLPVTTPYETRLHTANNKISHNFGCGLDYQFSQQAGIRANVLITNNSKLGDLYSPDPTNITKSFTAKLKHSAQFSFGIYSYLL